MGCPEHTGDFTIKSFGIKGQRDDYYFQAPLDLVQGDHTAPGKLSVLQPSGHDVVTDTGLCFYQAPHRDCRSPDVPWIDHLALKNYLLGARTLDPVSEPLFFEEVKTGIEKSGRMGTAKKHMLYVQAMLRLKEGHSFSVDAEQFSSLDQKGVLRMGHDGRIFYYQVSTGGNFDFLEREAIEREVARTGRFKLVFTSPALLKNGWIPGNVSGSGPYSWETGKFSILIESAVIGRPMDVGGWKMAREKGGSPKQMHRAVPPGSLYYCRLEKGSIGTVFDTLFDRNFSDRDSDLEKQGFGHMLIGVRP